MVIGCMCLWLHVAPPVIGCRLKRTTDVMFGGKQVLICGYGEVCFTSDCLSLVGDLTYLTRKIIKFFVNKSCLDAVSSS